MKWKITICFLLLFLTSVENLIGQFEIEIIPIICSSDSIPFRSETNMKIYGDKSMIYPISEKGESFIIEKEGEYTLHFVSIFDQNIEQKITITKKLSPMNICIDVYNAIIDSTYLQRLSIRDTLELGGYQTGCEFSDFGKIIITKESDGRLEANIYRYDVSKSIDVDYQLRKRLQDIESRIHIIDANPQEGFLRTNHYYLKYNGKKKMENVFSYPYLGLYYLMYELLDK